MQPYKKSFGKLIFLVEILLEFLHLTYCLVIHMIITFTLQYELPLGIPTQFFILREFINEG